MCGIAGVVGPNASEHLSALERMTAAMAHRGPDGEGIYRSPSGGCVLGHRRLAVIDLTPRSSQPMSDQEKQHVLVYNGACYNYRVLRDELTRSGERFVSSGDTEVVLRMLARHGEAALPRLNAMFAVAFWSERERRLLLARDRFGQKPLYLTRVGELVLFASEIRALLASGLVARRADVDATGRYLSCGAVQGPGTIVQGVSLLPAASYLTIEADGRESAGSYWTPAVDKRAVSPLEIRKMFADAVSRHLVSDAPIGLFLSGGIDSSAVTVAAARRSGGAVKSISVVFPEHPGYSEAEHARRIAALAGTDHHEVPMTGREMLRLLPRALDAMDQPTVDGINTYVVSHAARRSGLKAALSGLGGDELFGGYQSFRDVPRMLRLRHALGPLHGLAASPLGLAGAFNKRAAKIIDMLEATPDPIGLYLARRRLFTSRQVRRLIPDLAEDGWISGVSPEELCELEKMLDGREVHDAVGLLEMRVYMGQMLLRDSDAMGMAHGLEIRVPFLDAEFSDLILSLYHACRVPGRYPKESFTRALGEWLPAENTRRRKQGFAMPFRDWMLGELRTEVAEGIERLARADGPFDGETVRRVWSEFLTHPEKVGWPRPWSLFVLGRYLETHRLGL